MPSALWAQAEDEDENSSDMMLPEDSAKEHSVKRATWLAVTLPGAGQIYNRKYWKAPIVWAGIGAAAYFAYDNHQQHKRFLNAFYDLIDTNKTDEFNGRFTERNLIELQNIYADWRDLSIILGAVMWGLSIIDAHVDAHLFYFDVGDDLTWHFKPDLFYVNNFPAIGLGIKLRW